MFFAGNYAPHLVAAPEDYELLLLTLIDAEYLLLLLGEPVRRDRHGLPFLRSGEMISFWQGRFFCGERCCGQGDNRNWCKTQT